MNELHHRIKRLVVARAIETVVAEPVKYAWLGVALLSDPDMPVEGKRAITQALIASGAVTLQ